MWTVKLSTCAPRWPWRRQTPRQSGGWGPFKFIIDQQVEKCDFWIVFESIETAATCQCPPERTIFLTGEPDSIGGYHPDFLAQFHFVLTGRRDIRHPRVIRTQQGHPWFVERAYDELSAMVPMTKSREICAIVSDKAFTEGHRSRLHFVDRLQHLLGQRLEVFGRGIRDFESKWELLSTYRYSLVLEAHADEDWLTEKLPDAWLAYCYPFYFGCTNVNRYFAEGSWENIDVADPDGTAAKILSCIEDSDHYVRSLPAVEAARSYYLNHVQFFANLANLMQVMIGSTANTRRNISISPNASFGPISASHSRWRGVAGAFKRALLR